MQVVTRQYQEGVRMLVYPLYELWGALDEMEDKLFKLIICGLILLFS